jgi:hypothetical protein
MNSAQLTPAPATGPPAFWTTLRGMGELRFPGIAKPLAGFHFHGKNLVKIIMKKLSEIK